MSVLRLYPNCINCMKNKRISSIPKDCTEEQRSIFISKMQEIFDNALPFESAPVISSRLSRLFYDIFGIKKDLTCKKDFFNDLVLSREQEFIDNINNSPSPLKLALQYSIIANYMDFSSVSDVNSDTLLQLLSSSNKVDLSDEYDNLVLDLLKANNLLFICDNSGEVVFDKLLLQTIKKLYPKLSITVLVRGLPVDVDVTISDAKRVGLDKEFKIIDNGTDIPGTFIEGVNNSVKRAILSADLIISKGQGNFESMQKCNLNVYYMFMCKCELFTNRFNVPRFTGKLINEKRIRYDRRPQSRQA